MTVDEKLVSLRKEKGLTQLKVAEELGISRQAISRWESGTAVPSIENLRNLSELYDVSIDYLLDNRQERCSAEVIRSLGDPQLSKKNAKIKRVFVPKYFMIVALIFLLVICGIVLNQSNQEHEKLDLNDVPGEAISNNIQEFDFEWY